MLDIARGMCLGETYLHAHEHEDACNGHVTALRFVLGHILAQCPNRGAPVLVHLFSVYARDGPVDTNGKSVDEVIERQADQCVMNRWRQDVKCL